MMRIRITNDCLNSGHSLLRLIFREDKRCASCVRRLKAQESHHVNLVEHEGDETESIPYVEDVFREEARWFGRGERPDVQPVFKRPIDPVPEELWRPRDSGRPNYLEATAIPGTEHDARHFGTTFPPRQLPAENNERWKKRRGL